MHQSGSVSLCRSAISVLVATALYSPIALASTVEYGETVDGVVLEKDIQLVYGTANNTKINPGGEQHIKEFGVSSNTEINGGYQYIEMNGTAEYSVLNDGYQIVQMGGAANQTTLNNGVLQVYGAANDPTIKGGRLIVEKDGITVLAAIEKGGLLEVKEGGLAIAVDQKAGGAIKASPLAAFLFIAFIASHVVYIWADANFYRPITMQRANLPLSYPMTARRFLEKHGLLDAQEYQRRLIEQGNPDAVSVQYPLSELRYRDMGTGQNVLLITVDGLNYSRFEKQMPALAGFAEQNISFTRHMSSGNTTDNGIFGLFYGISPSYMDGILSTRTPAALITALNQQGYQLGLFSSDGFTSPLYRQALLSDFSMPSVRTQSDEQTATQWINWLGRYAQEDNRWFSWVSFNGTNIDDSNQQAFARKYSRAAGNVDDQINRVLNALRDSGKLDNTVVIITAGRGIPLSEDEETFDWSHGHLQVPLVIHWPGTPAQRINALTDHTDLMTTLMQRLLHVSTPASEYSQGQDLFNPQRRHYWVTAADNDTLAITTPKKTLVLNNNGKYRTYNLRGERVKDEKPQLSLLLQVLTDEKRFIAN
jgi:uncharacterized protein